MSSGTGGKPSSGSQPGRDVDASADTAVGALGSMTGAMGHAETSATGIGTMATGSIEPLAKPNDIIGATLSGRYLVTRKVGQGGMGAVYEATHTLIGKRVAVKVLLEKYAKREAIVQRLEQEARLASSVGNEHIIDITDFGSTEDGRTFVVMEFLEGESLAECLARETKLPEQRILRIASQTASALAAAHDKGVVHRDIKPENVFLMRRREQDFVKVVDFGISKSLRSSGEEEEQPRLTQTGMVLGTPLYMSPEQARGDDDLDARIDIYALGVIMYEAATGRVPFSGNNYLSVISQVLNEDPIPPRELRPDVTEELEAIILRAMAKDRADRYPSAGDLLTDLTALVEDPTHSTERAKITGPRKLRPGARRGKSSFRIAAWIAMIAVVIAAVVVTATLLLGGESKKKAALKDAAVVTPPPIDAAPPPPPDAPPVPTKTITIETDPPGAEIFEQSQDHGKAPVSVDVVVQNERTTFIARLPGYNDAQASVNSLIVSNKPIKIVLTRPRKGQSPTQLDENGKPIAADVAPKGPDRPARPTAPDAGTGSAPPAVTPEIPKNPYDKPAK